MWIVDREQRQGVRDLDREGVFARRHVWPPADGERRTALRREEGLGGGELGGLIARDMAGGQGAPDRPPHRPPRPPPPGALAGAGGGRGARGAVRPGNRGAPPPPAPPAG